MYTIFMYANLELSYVKYGRYKVTKYWTAVTIYLNQIRLSFEALLFRGVATTST